MTALSDITILPAMELSLGSSLASLAQEANVVEFRAHAAAVIGKSDAVRAQVAAWRLTLATLGAVDAAEIEAAMGMVEIGRRHIEQARHSYAVISNALRRKARRRPYLRPVIERLAKSLDLSAVECLEFLRDVRLELLANLASQRLERTGPVMSTPGEVRAYFSKFLAA